MNRECHQRPNVPSPARTLSLAPALHTADFNPERPLPAAGSRGARARLENRGPRATTRTGVAGVALETSSAEERRLLRTVSARRVFRLDAPETALARVGCAIAALALSALTVALWVIAPSQLRPDGNDATRPVEANVAASARHAASHTPAWHVPDR